MYVKQNFRPWQSAGLVKSLFLAISLIAVFGLNPIRAHGAERQFNLGSFTLPAGATFEQKVSGAFLDIYSFELASADFPFGVIGASLGAVGIADLMVGLWTNGSEIGASQMIATPTWNFSAFTDLPTNSIYELRVSGQSTAPTGGAYAGAFGMAVSPAPEPEIYAMMAVGLVVMGWAGRRRRKQHALITA
jgi:PEP-CTERM motif